MIVDHRTYTFKPGSVPRWLDKFEREGLPIQRKYLGTFMGLFTTDIGNLHQIVMLWGYESLAEREAKRAAMAESPEWKTFIGEVWALDCIETQEIKILRPTAFSPAWP
jgi:hypothetical protein